MQKTIISILKYKKKYYFYIVFILSVFCFFTNNTVFSQSTTELEAQLKTASSEEKPAILNKLAESLLKNNTSKSIDYAEQALKASRKLYDIENESVALINLGDGYTEQGNQKKAVQYYKDAIKLFDKYGQPLSSAYLWNKISDSYLTSGNYEDAIAANSTALEIFKTANNKKGMLSMYIDIGDIQFKQQKYESSIPNYKNALKIYEEMKDPTGQVVALNRIGTSYSQWGNYDEAYIFLSRALDISNKNNLTSQANAITQNLEIVKKNMSNWQKSQTEYAIQAQKDQQDKVKNQEQQIKTKETEINSLAFQNIKSIEEIEQLSVEAQLSEFKIKTQQEDIRRKQMEADAQTKANEYLKKEKEFADSELKTQRIIIWGGIGFSLLGLILTGLVFSAYRNKKKANSVLQQKNDIIYKQKDQIEQKNLLITDSIDYAKSIQEAILPLAGTLNKHFPQSFIYYKPKDIVSGDFYWIHEADDNNCVCLAAADCTGHGVPGAFMSLLGFIMLDEISRRNSQVTPADILKQVNTQLLEVLHQNTENKTGKFGMDIALIKFNKIKNEIIFSGAHNPLIIVNDTGLTEIKADRISIGSFTDRSFTNHTIQPKKGDMIYMYSDGYQDQIGGEKRKKFFALNFKDLLKEIHSLPTEKQLEVLDKKHTEWKGNNDQTDDIIIIGIKV